MAEEEWSEVFIDENGNAWAGDQLIVIEGEKGSLITPPAGITKGPPASMKDGVYQFSAGSTGQGGPSTFGTGTFAEADGDISKITSILNGIKNIDWGSLKKIGGFFKDNLDTIISGAALWSSMKSDDKQEEILNKQLDAADEALAAWREDRGESKEARTTLYDALQARVGQGAPPALMPGKVAYANPYQNVVKIGRGAEGSGSPESGPGATLGDAIRSTFTDRHPNAPPQQFIQQHPDRFARPGGPSTWENQGGPPPQPEDQSMRPDRGGPRGGFDQWFQDADAANASLARGQSERIGTESSDPYNAQGGASQGGGIPYSDAQERERSIWERRNNPRTRGTPIGTPRKPGQMHDPTGLLAMALQQKEQEPREPQFFDTSTPEITVVPTPSGPEPTAEEWQMLLEYPELMDIYKSTGRVVGR